MFRLSPNEYTHCYCTLTLQIIISNKIFHVNDFPFLHLLVEVGEEHGRLRAKGFRAGFFPLYFHGRELLYISQFIPLGLRLRRLPRATARGFFYPEVILAKKRVACFIDPSQHEIVVVYYFSHEGGR